MALPSVLQLEDDVSVLQVSRQPAVVGPLEQLAATSFAQSASHLGLSGPATEPATPPVPAPAVPR
jgi:hypothetical protein